MIKKMDMENLLGEMEGCGKALGLMISKMERARILMLRERKELGYGSKEIR
jgi:hypothetical protein